MSSTRSILLSALVATSLGYCDTALAQHCKWRFDQAFSLLSSRGLRSVDKVKNQAEAQAKIAAEVDFLFGPRQAECEEGAYSLFIDRFERYTLEALRQSGNERDLRLRAALFAIRKSPELINYTQASKEISLFRQARSNIAAVAQDAGMSPLMQQLVDAMEAVGAPKASQRPDTAPAKDPHSSMVYVPTVPLPAWAVVSLYEIQDHARRNESGAIQGKVEAILTWMKTVTPQTTPQP